MLVSLQGAQVVSEELQADRETWREDMPELLRQLVESLSADCAYIYTLSEDNGTLRTAAAACRLGQVPEARNSSHFLPLDDPWPLDRLMKGEVVTMERRRSPGSGESAEERSMESVSVLVPLVHREVVRGVLVIEGARAGDLLSSVLHGVMRTMGAVLAALLQARRVQDELEEDYRNLVHQVRTLPHEAENQRFVAEGLRDILVVLNSDRNLPSILDYLVMQARSLLRSDACVLYRLDREQETVLIEATAGLPEALPTPTELPLEAGGRLDFSDLDALVLNESPVTWSDLTDSEVRRALESPTAGTAVRSWFGALIDRYGAILSVPLVVKQTFYGTLGLYYTSPRAFSEEDVSLAMSFGSQAALAIENARLRLQTEHAAVLQERSRLARDLHDSVTQSLYSLTLLAEAARRLAAAGDLPQVKSAITRLGEIGQQALREMRLLVYELRPLVLRREGLLRALSHRLETVERRAGIEAQLSVEGPLSLPPALEEQLYHLIQEALNNVLKHAAASAVSVRIESNAENLRVEVSDNGRGFDPNALAEEGGIGIASMRERVERLGGEFAIESHIGQGSRVIVSLDRPVDGSGVREVRQSG